MGYRVKTTGNVTWKNNLGKLKRTVKRIKGGTDRETGGVCEKFAKTLFTDCAHLRKRFTIPVNQSYKQNDYSMAAFRWQLLFWGGKIFRLFKGRQSETQIRGRKLKKILQ